MFIYIAFYEAMDKNGTFLFKKQVTLNFTEQPTNGDDLILRAERDAFSEATGYNLGVVEVIIVGITKL